MFWIGTIVGAFAAILGRTIYGLSQRSELANMLVIAARRTHVPSTPEPIAFPETPPDETPSGQANRAVGA